MREPKSSITALSLLRRDHNTLRRLFREFAHTSDELERKEIAGQSLKEMRLHTAVEERLFYAALRHRLPDSEALAEAQEEHHVADILMREMDDMDAGDLGFDAKFMVFAEHVRRHMREEETTLFPVAERAGLDLADLGRKMAKHRETLEDGAAQHFESDVVHQMS